MQDSDMNNHEYFMHLAIAEGRSALAEGEFPVGCVFVHDGEVIVRSRRKNSSGKEANEIDHAEILALRQLLRFSQKTEYGQITVYSTMEPCLMCYTTLLLSGIRRFVWAYEDVMGGGTNLQLGHLKELYSAMEVEIIPHILRQESLTLFQQFFSRYQYWRNSPLAEYTLAQSSEDNCGRQE